MTAMVSQQLLQGLQADFCRADASLAGYVLEGAVALDEGHEELMGCLRDMAAADVRHANLLARAIESVGGIPAPGLMDPRVTDLNYLSVSHLAQVVLKSRRSTISTLEGRVEQCEGQPQARALVLEVLDEDRALAERLAGLLDRLSPAPALSDAAKAAAPAGDEGADAKKGFDVRSFLAKRGGAKPKAPAAAGSASPPPAAEAPAESAPPPQEAAEAPAPAPEDKKPFDMKAFLAKKKQKAPESDGGGEAPSSG